jgi:hypothetical protein
VGKSSQFGSDDHVHGDDSGRRGAASYHENNFRPGRIGNIDAIWD